MGLFSITDAKATLNSALNIISPPDTPSADAQAQLANPQMNGVPTAAPGDSAGILHGVNPWNWKTIATAAIVAAVIYYAVTRKGPVAAVVKAVG